MANQRLPADKELVIGGGATDGQLALLIKNGKCTKVTALHCDHEEADTRMLLHAELVEMHRGLSFNPLILMCYCSVSLTLTRSSVTSCGFARGEGSLTLHPSPQDCSWCWTTDVQSPTCLSRVNWV